MAEQMSLPYYMTLGLMKDAAEKAEADRLARYNQSAAQILARGADAEASRVAGLGARDVAGRQAGVGALEGIVSPGRPTDVDFRSPAERSRAVSDVARPTSPGGYTPAEARGTSPGGIRPSEARATSPGGITPAEARQTFPGSDVLDAPSGPRDPSLRLTDAGTDVSQRFQANRPTTPGDSLQRARQSLRNADPQMTRQTEPFMPGTQRARLYEARDTTPGRASVSDMPTQPGRATTATMPTEQIPGSQVPTQTGRAASSVKASDLADEIMKIKNQATRTRFFADVIPDSEILEALTALEQMAPDEVVRLGADDAPTAVTRLMTRLASDPRTAETFASVAPKMARAAGKFGRFAGPVGSIIGAASDVYMVGSEFAATQDPVEQLRFVYTQQGEQPLKIGRGGLSRRSMETMAAENPAAIMSAVEEGILDPSVLVSLGLKSPPPAATKTSASAPARERTVFEDIDIQAGEPEASAAAARPARGGSTGNLMMGARGERVADVQKKLSALSAMTPGVSFDLGSTGADGVFGGKTRDAVKDFQRMSGIRVDGIVGPETRTALDKAMSAAVGAKEAEMAAKAEAVTPQVGAGLKRVDEGAFNAAASEFEDMAVIEPVGSDRDAPTQNTQAYLDLGLDEEVRPSAFPMFRRRRNRK